ncbi:hypothetical protein JWG45_07985 [Leptospira sp. 201903070]|uniref:Lipoprotein n=1 Tax=Leptospira ainlahdjerensis TaxID=2810033 RepID=A0ABS2U9Q9_9LEPT|nr:hypothetical protein [Leptospira ainlahdjerensis]MBM9577092.1 hypothetical protein [Leptospira ainlahdjerensis]
MSAILSWKERLIKQIIFIIQFTMILQTVSFGLSCKGGARNNDLLIPLIGPLEEQANSELKPEPESPNGHPLLNDLTVQTTYRTGTPDDQKIEVRFSFQKTPASPWPSIKAYLGRPNVMTLNPNDLSVNNFILEEATPNPFFPDRFIFFSPETSQPYKIIVVVSNPFGKSFKEINSVPPTPPQGPCYGAISAPVAVGNCDQHCIQVTANGNLIEFVAKDTTASIQNYFYLDLTTTTPAGGATPIPYTYIEFGLDDAQIPIASYSTAKKILDTQTYNDACVNVSSYRAIDGNSGFFDNFIEQKIIVP